MKKLLCQIGTTACMLAILMVAGALFEGTVHAAFALPALAVLAVAAWVLCQLPYVRIRWERAARPAVSAAKRPYAASAAVSRAARAGHAA